MSTFIMASACLGGLELYLLYFAPDRLIRTSRDHGNEMKDETTIQLRLDRESNMKLSGWKPSVLPLS